MKKIFENLFKKKEKSKPLDSLMGDGIVVEIKDGINVTNDFLEGFNQHLIKNETSVTDSTSSGWELPKVKTKKKPRDLNVEAYSEYVADNLDKAISYAAYIAEAIGDTRAPKKITSQYKKTIQESIVISLEMACNRPDLEFIGNSKVDGKPIYRYTGSDFTRFDLPYEEVISLEDWKPNLVNNHGIPITSKLGWIKNYTNSHKLYE
jgi:hypothetical protein